ncbi:MAG: 1,4-alpha-glucan branching enzyme [Frankiales bacterium]|nr:1,4-alpha-glucan branching enzyme [Frankiales bacterium]
MTENRPPNTPAAATPPNSPQTPAPAAPPPPIVSGASEPHAKMKPTAPATSEIAAAVAEMKATGEPLPQTAAVKPRAINQQDLERLVSGAHHDPHGILGAHVDGDVLTVRTLRPQAKTVCLVIGGDKHEMAHEYGGVFVVALPRSDVPDYRIEVTYDGDARVFDDPYRFMPTLGELDLHLVQEGRHERLWEVLGAHVQRYSSLSGEIVGTSFAVWAPSARGVRLVGDFNFWDGTAHPMRALGSSGVWELFVPGVGAGAHYKFSILGADSVWRHKADPLAFAAEKAPATASIVWDSSYEWRDDAWLTHRAAGNPYTAPMSIYEVHLASWKLGKGYRELAHELVEYVTHLGFTHVELLPVAEHPFGGSWGYQVTSYFAPTSRLGTPDDFRYLVDTLHQAGIGVIVDWVPAHFPKDEWALARFDGTALYEHADPRRGEQPDWGTYVFNFGRNEVRNFLVANALYWLEVLHVDGLRVDAVASMLYLDYSRKDGEWIPNQYGGRENLDAVQFLQEMNATVYGRVPGVITIAEESTAWPAVSRPTHLGGLGFGFKWNMGWMHDSLSYIEHEPIHRQYHHHEMTFSMVYAFTENFVLPISHDEVVHGKGSLLRKMPGDRWQQLANLRAYLAFMWAHPGKQLLFMGSEFGQESEWSESRSLDWWLLDTPDHRGLFDLVRDLNHNYRGSAALHTRDFTPDGFSWIDANDTGHNVFSFLRWGEDGSVVACIANFSGSVYANYRIGLPRGGEWAETLNTDSEVYGGSGVGNYGVAHAVDETWHGQPFSASITVPPLAVLWLTGPPAPTVIDAAKPA